MVSPQTENGYTRISNELLEAIIHFPFSKREYQILLAIIRKTYGYGKTEDDLGITQLARMTGLQHTHAAKTVRDLVENGVLYRNNGHYAHKLGIVKDFSKWGSKTVETVIPTMTETVIPTMTETVIPTMTETVIPTMTETVIGGDQNSHTTMTKTVRGGVTKTVSTKENLPKENPKRKPPLQKSDIQDEKIESSGGDFLDLKNEFTFELIFPKSLSLKERKNAEKLLSNCRDAQSILDVLEASIRAGEVKKSALSLLGGIIRRYEAGTFDPTPGLHISENREQQKKTQAEIERRNTEAITKIAIPKSEKFIPPLEQIEALKQALRGSVHIAAKSAT